MPSFFTSVLLLSAGVLPALVSAAPASYSVASAPTQIYSSISTSATPFALTDGFPDPSKDQLLKIQQLAQGTLPNGKPPATISSQGITSLQLINFNENFEVAFFSSLVQNITRGVPGFVIGDKATKDYILDTLIAVVAQEELHAINAAKALVNFGHAAIIPCKYVFPTTNLADAFALAATFTDVVLGTLQDVIQIFAQNGDAALTRGVASVVGQEGEQAGFYRLMQNNAKIPNALPFLTTSTRDFAFTALQSLIVPGSCPNIGLINLKTFGTLTITSDSKNIESKPIKFTVDIKQLAKMASSKAPGLNTDAWNTWTKNNTITDYSQLASKFSITYINQLNTPVSQSIKNVTVSSTGVVSFAADFPYAQFEMNGLTIAAVTVGSNFTTAPAVANATLFGPAFIEIN